MEFVKDMIFYVDFLWVIEKMKIVVEVFVYFVNEEELLGFKCGGVLNIVRCEIEFLCLVSVILSEIEFDIVGLDIGDIIKIFMVSLL